MVRGGARTRTSPLAWRVRWSCRSSSALLRVLQVDSDSSAIFFTRCSTSRAAWSKDLGPHVRVYDRARGLIFHPKEDPSRDLMTPPPCETCRILLAHSTRLLLVAGTAGEAGQRNMPLHTDLFLAGHTSDPARRCRCSGCGVTKWGGCLEELAGRKPGADCGLG